jgi:ribonuclease PH
MAMAVHQAIIPSVRLETFPKSTIDIFITVIETDGIEGCVAAGSIAASTALVDAGIEVIGLVVSCSAVRCLYIARVFRQLIDLLRLSLAKKRGWIRRLKKHAQHPEPWCFHVCLP